MYHFTQLIPPHTLNPPPPLPLLKEEGEQGETFLDVPVGEVSCQVRLMHVVGVDPHVLRVEHLCLGPKNLLEGPQRPARERGKNNEEKKQQADLPHSFVFFT